MATKNENQNRKEIRGFLEKIVIDAGVGRLSQTPNFEDKTLTQVTRDLANVTGQKPELRRAKKSIAGFKLREGQIVGLRTTLRRDKMVDFFERLVTIVLPRVRDFNGLDHKAIDKGGTLNVGIREHQVFPEIVPEQSPVSFSLGVSIVPKEKNREKAVAEFLKLGVPMKKQAEAKTKKK
ncbi:MAG TPA: 50S ribosomal protein L5 [Candidatus Paceibacterota bacterium]|nr:50S ribosomal protein L5 [Candidatus Paceibacterota bacterium]